MIRTFSAAVGIPTTGLASAHAQTGGLPPPGYGAAESRRKREEVRQMEAVNEAQRANAHARLERSAVCFESRSSCPVMDRPRGFSRAASEKLSRLFIPRSTLLPLKSRPYDLASGPVSSSGLSAVCISGPLTQPKCGNCEFEAGISGQLRLVLVSSAGGYRRSPSRRTVKEES